METTARGVYFKSVEKEFKESVSGIMAMVENFQPNMINDYNRLKERATQAAITLIKLGEPYQISGDKIYVEVNGESFQLEIKDVQNLMGDDFFVIFENDLTEEEKEEEAPIETYAEPVRSEAAAPAEVDMTSILSAIREELRPCVEAVQRMEEKVGEIKDEAAIEPYKLRISMLEKSVEEAEAEKNRKSAELDEVKAGMQKELQKVIDERDNAQNDLAKACLQIEEMNKNLKNTSAFEEERERLNREIENRIIMLDDKDKVIDHMQESADSMARAISGYKETIEEKDRRIRSLEAEKERNSGDINDIADEIRRDIERETATKNQQAIREAVEQAEKQLKERLSKENENHTHKLVEQLNNCKNEKTRLSDEFEQYKKDVEKKHKDSEDELVKEKDKKLEEANKQVKSFQIENENLKKRLDMLSSEKKGMESDAEILRKAAEAAKDEQEQFRISVNGQLEELRKLAFFDSKTETWNLNAFNRDLHTIQRENTILVMLGINGMRQVNGGDQLISFVAKKLVEEFSIDNVYRILGDQFVVLFYNDTYKNVSQLMSDLQKELANLSAYISYGIADGKRSKSIQEMIKWAENYMMKSKRVEPEVEEPESNVEYSDADDEEEEEKFEEAEPADEDEDEEPEYEMNDDGVSGDDSDEEEEEVDDEPIDIDMPDDISVDESDDDDEEDEEDDDDDDDDDDVEEIDLESDIAMNYISGMDD